MEDELPGSEGHVDPQPVDKRIVGGQVPGPWAQPLNVWRDIEPGGCLVLVEKLYALPIARAEDSCWDRTELVAGTHEKPTDPKRVAPPLAERAEAAPHSPRVGYA